MRAIDIPKEELTVMYQEEFLTLRDIAEYFDCGASTVYRKMIKFGIQRRDMNELRIWPQVPCSKCKKLKPSASKYDVCKDCWDKQHGRERWPSGGLVPVGYVRKKRKFIACKNCKGKIATWNKTGYCGKCQQLTKIRNDMGCKFCTICEKAICYSNKSGLCFKHSVEARSKKTIFKRDEAIIIFDNALSDIGVEGKKKQEAIRAFSNLLAHRFFFGYTGNNHNALKGELNETGGQPPDCGFDKSNPYL